MLDQRMLSYFCRHNNAVLLKDMKTLIWIIYHSNTCNQKETKQVGYLCFIWSFKWTWLGQPWPLGPLPHALKIASWSNASHCFVRFLSQFERDVSMNPLCRRFLLHEWQLRLDWHQHWESRLAALWKRHCQRYKYFLSSQHSTWCTYIDWFKKYLTVVSFIFPRGVSVCSQCPRPADDRGRDTDPLPGPHWPSLHPELWFCFKWESKSYWYWT